MPLHPRTVVAWDGSADASWALDWAIERARPVKGTVVIVRVVDDSFFSVVSPDMAEETFHDALTDLEDQVQRLATVAPGVQVGSEILRGDPLAGLTLMTNPQTLLVLGVSDASAPFHRKPWSLARRLVTTARGPFVVVPANHPAEARTVHGQGVTVRADSTVEGSAARRFAAAEALIGGDTVRLVDEDDTALLRASLTARLLVVGADSTLQLDKVLGGITQDGYLPVFLCPVIIIGPLAATGTPATAAEVAAETGVRIYPTPTVPA